MAIIVTYIHSSRQATLGIETSHDIDEVTYSDPYFIGSPIFLVKKFTGYSNYNWRVIHFSHAISSQDSNLTVYLLEAENNIEYLAKTLKKRRVGINSLVPRGTLVEVDFGYHSSVYKANGDTRSGKRYTSNVLFNEMHKRRLAIVVNSSGHRVQVVPISSKKPPIGDKSCFLVSSASLSMLIQYNQTHIDSYAICSMLQTVSTSRILPPKYQRRTALRDTGYPAKIRRPDSNKLNDALANTLNLTQISSLSKKLSEATSTIDSQAIELARVKADLEKFRNLTKTYVRDFYDVGDDEAMEYIQSDLSS